MNTGRIIADVNEGALSRIEFFQKFSDSQARKHIFVFELVMCYTAECNGLKPTHLPQKPQLTCNMKLLIAYSDCHLEDARFSGVEFKANNWHSSIASMASEAASAVGNDSTVSLLCSNITSLFGAEDWGVARHMIMLLRCLNSE